MSFQWQPGYRPEDVWEKNTQRQIAALEADIVALVNSMLDDIASDMRLNAPWQDRTGRARRSLFTALIHDARQTVGILLSHGSLIEYSVFLEYAHAGRFAILAPTVDVFAPRFFAGVQKIVRARFG